MELTGIERFLLLKVIPDKAKELATLRILPDMRRALSFSEDELVAIGYEEGEGGGFKVNLAKTAAHVKEIELGMKARSIVHDALATLLKSGEMTTEYLTLCEKFELE